MDIATEAAVDRCSFKIGALKNFAKFTGKHLRWSMFLIKFQAFRPGILLKRSLSRCFPVNFGIFFYENHFYRTHPVAAFFAK